MIPDIVRLASVDVQNITNVKGYEIFIDFKFIGVDSDGQAWTWTAGYQFSRGMLVLLRQPFAYTRI